MRESMGKGVFLSTPSARRATSEEEQKQADEKISIHALREEGDPRHIGIALQLQEFLSTPSARRATYDVQVPNIGEVISIHALREEGDSKNRDKISIFKQIVQHSARI